MVALNPHTPVPETVRNGYDLLDVSHYEQEIERLLAHGGDPVVQEREKRRVCLLIKTLHTKLVQAAGALAGLLQEVPGKDPQHNTALVLAQWRKADYTHWKEQTMPLGLLTNVSLVWKIKNNETVMLFYDNVTVTSPPQVGHLINVGVPGVFFSVTSIVTATTDVKMPGDCVAIYSASFTDEMVSYLQEHLKEWSTPETCPEAADVIKRFVPEWL